MAHPSFRFLHCVMGDKKGPVFTLQGWRWDHSLLIIEYTLRVLCVPDIVGRLGMQKRIRHDYLSSKCLLSRLEQQLRGGAN